MMLLMGAILTLFLSTLSLRRATYGCCGKCRYWGYFYPRSPCGERPSSVRVSLSGSTFLSTLSLRRATGDVVYNWLPYAISIHALLAESDISLPEPCYMEVIFLSTLSLRRATKVYGYGDNKKIISIHALLAESDYLTNYHFTVILVFLSTLSLRRATCQ